MTALEVEIEVRKILELSIAIVASHGQLPDCPVCCLYNTKSKTPCQQFEASSILLHSKKQNLNQN